MIYYYECKNTPRFCSMFTVVRDTKYEIANTVHKLFYIENGSCKISIHNNEYILNKGDILYIPANTTYIRSPINDKPCEIFSVCFEIDASKSNILNPNNVDYFTNEEIFTKMEAFKTCQLFFLPCMPIGDLYKKSIKRQILRIKSAYDITRPFNIQATSFALCTLLTTFSDIAYSMIVDKPETLNIQEYPDPLKKAIVYIKEHYNEQITLDDLCKNAYVSKQMLIRYFNKYFGKSPLVYITEYKLNLIRSLLTSSEDISIKEICSLFGFNDQCYFSRVFKKHIGKSPTEYIKNSKF